MKILVKLLLVIAVSSFLNPAFATATPKVEIGEVYISCPLGSCWVIAGALVEKKNSDIYDHYLASAGFRTALHVKTCDRIYMQSEGLFVSDAREFFVAPCQDKSLTGKPIHLGDTIRVTGAQHLVNYEVVAGK